MSQQAVKYAVDLVMCIDGTGSMGPVIEEVKSSALEFYEKIEAAMAKQQKKIDQLRTRVIVFRDYWADSEDFVMQCSEFLDLRSQSSEFANFVSKIEATGGGDEPENGLEALALALNSNWEKSQYFAKQRHVVVLYTDASAHDLEKGEKPSHYPKDKIPHSLDELTDMWQDMSTTAKRLLLFAPDASPWNVISNSWDNAIYYPSQAGQGLEEYEMEEIVDRIASSV